MHPWLKAWIAHSKKIAKGMHSDFIHTKDGSPCFVQIFDNYYDLRERFFICVQSFKKLYPCKVATEKRFTWIVDRGILGIDTLLRINESGDNIITWEKGYKQNGWDPNLPYKATAFSKTKNDFKFLAAFFGIDQIISYRYFTYEEIAHLFKDRLVEAEDYKKTNKERLLLEKN